MIRKLPDKMYWLAPVENDVTFNRFPCRKLEYPLKELYTRLKINWNHNDSNHINTYYQWSNEPVNLCLNFDISTNYIPDN